MLRRYWLPVLAVVGLLAVAAHAQGVSDHAARKPSATQGQPKPKADSPPAIPVAVQNDIHSIASALKAANEKKPSADEDKRARDNLKAQQDTAYWARYMFWVGFGELIVTGAGVFLVWRTLKASWAAAREAKRAADAANASLNHAKESTERQLRAYVGIDSIKLEITSDILTYEPTDLTSQNIIFPDFLAITVKNYGETPAKNVQTRVAIGRGPHLLAMPSDYDYDAVFSQPVQTGNIITRTYLNRMQAESIKSPIDPRHVWATKAKEAGLVVYGRIYYTDVFDKNWSTKFCYIWEPWHPPGERFVASNAFNGEEERAPPA